MRHRRMPPSHAFVTGVCKSGKKAFWTMAGARALVKTLKRQGGQGKQGLHAYDCPFCNYFHVGHLPDGVIRGRVNKRDAFPRRERPAQ